MQLDKKIAHNAFWLYLRMGIAMLTAFFVSRVVIDKLGAADYGTYSVVVGAVAILGFVNRPLTYSAQRFLAVGADAIAQQRRLFSNLLAVHLFFAVVVTALSVGVAYVLAANYLQLSVDEVYIIMILIAAAAITIFIEISTSPYLSLICVHEKMVSFVEVQIVEVVVQIAIAVTVAMVDENRLIIYAIMQCFARLVQRVLYMIICMHKYEESRTKPQFDSRETLNILRISTWNMVGSAGQTSVVQGLNIMLNAHFGALANAARAIAMQVQSTALEFSQNFLQALSPRLMRSVATTNNAWTKTKTSTFLMLCISSVVALPIIIWTDEILAFWLKEVPALSADFVRLILVSMVFESASEVLQTTALTIGKLRSFQLTTIAGAVVTLVLAYLLVNSEFVPQSIFMVQAAVSLFVFVAKALIVRRIVKAFA
ncbi:MAG: hypothetical protein J6Y72_00640 [Bacteroidales bacterium]|nr:hypothetical protein [Bacteroidales bacterium]